MPRIVDERIIVGEECLMPGWAPPGQENLFSEERGSGDFPTVRHLRLRGDNREIGWSLATIARERYGLQLEASSDEILDRARRHYFERNYAVHAARARGVAEAFGVTPTDVIDTNELWYPRPGLRTLGGCSVVAYPPDLTHSGHAILSRNYDFPTGSMDSVLGLSPETSADARPWNAEPYVMEVYPNDGYPSLYLSCFDLLAGCLDGINAAGLVVALLADNETMAAHKLEPTFGYGVGLNELQTLRFLLDTCATVDEAKHALLLNKQHFAVVLNHYLILDASGRSFVWEYGRSHNREYIIDGRGAFVVTNHPLHRYPTGDVPEVTDGPVPQLHSYNRYRFLRRHIDNQPKPVTLDAMKEINACVFADQAPRSLWGEQAPVRTLWHSLYDATDRRVEVSFYLRDESDPDRPAETRVVRSPYVSFELQR